MKLSILLGLIMILAGCATGHKQYLDFEGFTVEQGIYKAKPGWRFIPQEGGTLAVAKKNNATPNGGGTIEPCECEELDAISGGSLGPTGGTCGQASTEDADGNILDVWCVNLDCNGYCSGGITAPSGGGKLVNFRLECVDRFARE